MLFGIAKKETADANASRYQDFAREYRVLRQWLHEQVVTTVDVAELAKLGSVELERRLANAVLHLCRQRSIQLSDDDLMHLVEDVIAEALGFGPLEPLMNDPSVSDILVNGPKKIYVERAGILCATDIEFLDDNHLMTFIQRLVHRMGRRIDESSAMVDVRMPDGSRLNAIIPPLALRGPTLSIRRFNAEPLLINELVARKSLHPEMAEFLIKAVQTRCNILISGSTGSGKTTLLNSLSQYIPHSERVITVEQTAELQLQQPDVVALESRPPNIEGKGETKIADLLKNTLRMRPDRIIVGECRGSEIFEIIQAMLTGHDGSMTTLHASDNRDALRRIELLVAMSGIALPTAITREYVAAAMQLLVHVRRLPTGERKVVQISEIQGVHNGELVVQDIYVYQWQGTEATGRAMGGFHVAGPEPRAIERMRNLGQDPKLTFGQPRHLTFES